MGYAESKLVGDRGEAIVAEVLKQYTASDGIALHDLLFDGVDTTTQVDHILIDRFGLLLIETKFYNALIKGTSDDRTWTACYRDGKRRQFHNPLRQNEGHRSKLLRVLQQHGFRLDSSYTQSVIVFANGSIDDLDLAPEDRARVLATAEFDHHLATRPDFAPNSGDLNPNQVAAIAEIISSLDCSGDSTVQARHDQMVKEASKRRRGKAGRFTRGAAPRRPSTPRTSSKPESRTSPLVAMIGILVALAALWGQQVVSHLASAVFSGAPAPPVAQPSPAAPSVPEALARLREADPVIAGSLVDPDNPVTSTVNGYPTYTWQYMKQDGAQAASIKSIRVSFDQTGRIVGVSEE